MRDQHTQHAHSDTPKRTSHPSQRTQRTGVPRPESVVPAVHHRRRRVDSLRARGSGVLAGISNSSRLLPLKLRVVESAKPGDAVERRERLRLAVDVELLACGEAHSLAVSACDGHVFCGDARSPGSIAFTISAHSPSTALFGLGVAFGLAALLPALFAIGKAVPEVRRRRVAAGSRRARAGSGALAGLRSVRAQPAGARQRHARLSY